MIDFNYETDFTLPDESVYENWIMRVAASEGKEISNLSYIFCDDSYLHEINLNYLKHDDYTDIISFDYSEENLLQGDIFISIERVKENAGIYQVSFLEELQRVMIHGVLHYCGYKDKSEVEAQEMRSKENEKIKMFHVEH